MNSQKKQLGIYYTPDLVSRVLVGWAVRSCSEYILEPSFGSCGFLESIVDQLESEGCPDPLSRVYGFDVDPGAFVGPYESLIETNDGAGHFSEADFLQVEPRELSCSEFSAIIGNPPYVSYHNMTREQRRTTKDAIKRTPYSLDRKASLWAYFVVYSLCFLKEAGRIAWVLPGSFLFADYARCIHDIISGQFNRSLAVAIRERIFLREGAVENSVVLLAEGWSSDTGTAMQVGQVSTVEELGTMIGDWQRGECSGVRVNSVQGRAFVESEVEDAMQEVRDYCKVKKLDDVAEFRIGVVTGDNKFFVVDKDTLVDQGLEDDDWEFIMSKARICSGIRLVREDLSSAAKSGFRCLLINGNGNMSQRLEAYFNQMPQGEIESNVTFAKRKDWRAPDDGVTPDAFFTYMQRAGPRLILNEAGVNSTNTLHRVFFNSTLNQTARMAVAIGLVGTFGQLSAEIEGRSYGSGVLKHELGDTRRIQVPLPREMMSEDVTEVFENVDVLLREGDVVGATRAADKLTVAALGCKVCSVLRAGLRNARLRRGVEI